MPGYFAKNEQHRRLVLKALLWITLSGGLFFSVVNLLHDNWLLAGLEIGYAAVSLYLLTIVDRTHNLQLLTAVYLLPFFSIMILALAQTHTSFAVFAWIQSIPIICYLLLGLRLGMYGSVLFVGIGLFVFSRRFASDQLLQNIEIIANLGLASLAVMTFAHIYERSRLLNEQRLEGVQAVIRSRFSLIHGLSFHNSPWWGCIDLRGVADYQSCSVWARLKTH